MSQVFEAVIYDMDGVIIDSEPIWRQVEIKVFKTVGLELTEQDCMQTMGMRFDEVVNFWWERRPWTGKTKQQVHDEVLDEMERQISTSGRPMPGVIESIDFFKAKGARLALASSSAMRLINATTNRLGIAAKFEFLVTAENEKYGKPHPAVFLRTAELLHVNPEKCLVIEDSFFGLLAAKAAKMKCAVVPEPQSFRNPKFVIADWKLKSLEDVKNVFG